ncbi:hypothetical protein ILYODFUR_026022 [Ilyodon furcidens]|uniref:Uncharacterized protein n=1 Tax=Ilyodon furcidens TaxID=33524 RepID=A0ABV0T095_9TELE
MYVTVYALNTWLGLLFMNFCINGACHGANQPVTCKKKKARMRCCSISWKMTALSLDLTEHIGPTLANDMAAQIKTDCGNLTVDLKQLRCCASTVVLQTLGPVKSTAFFMIE